MANTTLLRTTIIVLSMFSAIAAGKMLKPTPLYTDASPPPIKLAQAVPTRFADWTEEPNQQVTIVSPEVAAMLQSLYSDNLTRTYINAKGERIMMSLAYGADQSRALQVHKPEVCYESQGYKISGSTKSATPTVFGHLPVMRVLASRGARNEPITYWIRSGDIIVRGWYEQNLARVKAGLAGHYPDGILVRISSIDGDTSHAYASQDAFIQELVRALPPEGRQILLGAQFTAPKPATP
ncbi:MAG: EpsI family protein [Aquabacterium sp.]|nr:EpsI family protein [Aquabacterium sp.]